MMKNKKAILFLVIAVLLLALYYAYIDDRLYAVIDGKIYRSRQLAGNELRDVIRKKNIQTIINLRGVRRDETWYQTEREVALNNNVNLYNVALPDHDLPKYIALSMLVDILMKAEKPLLIHCWRGADRSGLASALALSIEKDLPLPEIKKQFSWRYGVIPLIGSIGPLVFARYENWLDRTHRKHDRLNLLYWIKKAYVDDYGNMEFWIDTVSDRAFDHWKVNLKKTTRMISIKGWAYDAQKRSLPNAFHVIIDEQTSAKVNHRFYRPDAAEYLGLEKNDHKKVLLGWEVLFDGKDLTAGCHRLSVKFSRRESKSRTLPTRFQICID